MVIPFRKTGNKIRGRLFLGWICLNLVTSQSTCIQVLNTKIHAPHNVELCQGNFKPQGL
jgi:hypothetical protein